jgi:hypothetical protein
VDAKTFSRGNTLRLFASDSDSDYEILDGGQTHLVHQLKCFDSSKLNPTVPLVKTLSDLIGTSNVFSERQGKVITIQEPCNQSLAELKKHLVQKRKLQTQHSRPDSPARRQRSKLLLGIQTERAKHSLNPTRTTERSISDVIGTNCVFSERQGKVITIQEPNKSRVSGNTLKQAKHCLTPTQTYTRSISDVIGTNHVFSERQGKAITIQEPNKSRVSGHCLNPTQIWTRSISDDLKQAKHCLNPTQTWTRSISDVLGTNCIFSERQGKAITIQEPNKSCVNPTQRSTRPENPIVDAIGKAIKQAKHCLTPTQTCTRSISDVIGTNHVFSERQGKAITIQEPLQNININSVNIVESLAKTLASQDSASVASFLAAFAQQLSNTAPKSYAHFLLEQNGNDFASAVKKLVVAASN